MGGAVGCMGRGGGGWCVWGGLGLRVVQGQALFNFIVCLENVYHCALARWLKVLWHNDAPGQPTKHWLASAAYAKPSLVCPSLC